jgi:pSer/pThr/pTyr-binding forkhead associated (FHA) protein
MEAPRAEAKPAVVVCTECRSENPPEYRFCVTCGASLKRAKAAGDAPPPLAPQAAAPAAPVVKHLPPVPPSPAPAAPSPIANPASAFEGEKIIGAPVLDIAASSNVPAKVITCSRCQGQSVAGTRFCKFCGAPLEEGQASARRGPVTAPGVSPSPGAVAPAAAPAPVASAPPPPPISVEAPRTALAPAPPPLASTVASAPAPQAPPPRPAPRAEPAPAPAPEPIGKVPLAPISKPSAAQSNGGAPRPAPPPPAPEPKPIDPPALAPEPGVRAEVSVLAGSPIPDEPFPFPPRPTDGSNRAGGAVPGRWKGGRLVVIVEDGTEGRSFSLAEGQLDIGRTDGDIVLEDDPYVSPRHARLRRIDGKWILRDLDSTNHVYVRLRKPYPLQDGDLLLLGLEVLQFQTVNDGERGLGHAIQHGTFLFGSPATPRRARLCQRTVEGVIRDVYHLFRDETTIGREVGDIVFTADPFLSRRHAAIRRNPVTSEFSLVDLDSSNGTYVAIQGEITLEGGDYLRIGQHLFRVDLG